jgi:hypothetical protein
MKLRVGGGWRKKWASVIKEDELLRELQSQGVYK